MPCDAAAHGGISTHTYAEQPISLDGADCVSPGAPNANAEDGDLIGHVVTIIGPRTTLASARDPEMVPCRAKHEQRRSKPLGSNNPLWKFFMVYLKDSLPGIAALRGKRRFRLCRGLVRIPCSFEAASRHHEEGHREALKEHEAQGAGNKGGGSGGASSEKDAGSIIAYMNGVKPFTSKMTRFIIDSSNNRWPRLGETFTKE